MTRLQDDLHDGRLQHRLREERSARAARRMVAGLSTGASDDLLIQMRAINTQRKASGIVMPVPSRNANVAAARLGEVGTVIQQEHRINRIYL